VRTKFEWYYQTWTAIEPLIKRLDSSRYMLLVRRAVGGGARIRQQACQRGCGVPWTARR
jgi:hypothetical protein